MKKAIRITLPLVLALTIILCTGWYLLIYDREFTRDVLLHAARFFESNGNRTASTWFYNTAYLQAGDNDSIAVELADQYKESGNYTKAEYTLSNAIADGGGVELYIALCKTYVEQDKLLDAVNMLNNVTNKEVKAQLELLRPAAPKCTPDPTTSGSYYTQYITVEISADNCELFVSTDSEFPSVLEDRYERGITLKNGENVIYAVAVAENGLVSPAAIFSFTVGGVIEEVSFADTAVEAAMRETLGVSADKVLYTNDLWVIKEFTVPEGTATLTDLRHLAFLEKLTVNNCVSGQLSNISTLANLQQLQITDTVVAAEELFAIGHLPKLQTLVMNNCSLSTTAGLEFAVGLANLDLSNNAIRNIASLGRLTKLQQLNLSHNALNDLTALSTLSSLVNLDVSYNNISELTPVCAITGLKTITAGNNVITEVTGIEKLTALIELDVSNNKITDTSAIASCLELTKLNVSGNALTNITAYSALTKLTDLNFAHNKVKKLPQWKTDCALVNIDGSYNQLNSLEPLKGLKQLNNVFMDYNKEISSVKALASCPLLIQVNVYGTGVTQVSALTSQSIVVNYDPTK